MKGFLLRDPYTAVPLIGIFAFLFRLSCESGFSVVSLFFMTFGIAMIISGRFDHQKKTAKIKNAARRG